jgi:hypothetical protein
MKNTIAVITVTSVVTFLLTAGIFLITFGGVYSGQGIIGVFLILFGVAGIPISLSWDDPIMRG